MSPTYASGECAEVGDDKPVDVSKISLQPGSVYLPREILLDIVKYISQNAHGQRDLASFCLVSRSFYLAGVERLYNSPRISSKNFDAFIRTMCPSINLHVRRSSFGSLVRTLDMSRLIHDGSKSLTARLLGRVKENLALFIAPAATFSLSCFAALAKCQNLKVLNLRFVIDKIDLPQLFKSIGKLPNLEELYLRAVTLPTQDNLKRDTHQWPPKLERLTIVGHLCRDAGGFLAYRMPAEECKLQFLNLTAYCLPCHSYLRMNFARNIRCLELTLPQDESFEEFDTLLLDHPNLNELSIEFPAFSSHFFQWAGRMFPPHPLTILTLSSAPTKEKHMWRWSVAHIVDAFVAGGLSNLRQLQISEVVAAYCNAPMQFPPDDPLRELSELMEVHENETKESGGGGYETRETGVWIIE